jgi:hypothetical protein
VANIPYNIAVASVVHLCKCFADYLMEHPDAMSDFIDDSLKRHNTDEDYQEYLNNPALNMETGQHMIDAIENSRKIVDAIDLFYGEPRHEQIAFPLTQLFGGEDGDAE